MSKPMRTACAQEIILVLLTVVRRVLQQFYNVKFHLVYPQREGYKKKLYSLSRPYTEHQEGVSLPKDINSLSIWYDVRIIYTNKPETQNFVTKKP